MAKGGLVLVTESWPLVPKHGAPTQAVQFELSTAHVDPREAYDYWRDIAYYYFEADRLPVDDRRDFEAHTKIIATPTGNIYAYESGPVSGRRTFGHIRADQGDSFDLGLVLAGRRRHRDETDAVQNAMQGEFFCYDAAKPSRVEWGYHRGIHLTIPRTMIASSIGDIPPATEIVKALATSPLAPFLQAHLRVLASTLDRLSQSERAIIFDHTVDLTLSVLRQAIQSDAHPNLITKRSYYLAAKRIIHNHFSDPNLDAIRLSEMLGCSRSTLYRAFAAEGWTVADYIKEVRLREASICCPQKLPD